MRTLISGLRSLPSTDVRVRRRWLFWAVAYTNVVLLAGTNVPTPLYAGYEREFGFSALMLTLVFAAYVAALIPSLLLAGPLSDAVGRRPVLVPAVTLAIIGSAVFAAAGGTGWLFAARLIQGVCVGVASGALTAALTELEPDGDRRRATLVAAVSPVLGISVGPLLSGLLAQYLPAPHVVPYLAEIVLLVPALIAMSILPTSGTGTRWRPRRPQVPPPIRRSFVTSGGASFLAWAAAALFLTLVPGYLSRLAHTTNLALAGAVATLMLGSSALAQRASYGSAPRPLQLRGMALLAAGLTLLIIAGQAGSFTVLLIATVAAGVGHGLAFLGAVSEINLLAPPDRHADVLSSFFVVTYCGTGLPIIGVGALATHIGLLHAVQYAAAIVAALCLLTLTMRTLLRPLTACPADH